MKVSFKTRKEIFERDGGHCALCGRELHMDKSRSQDNDYIQLDHRIPKSQGGSSNKNNLRAVCKPCNSKRNKYSGAILKQHLMRIIRSASLGGLNGKRILDDIRNGFLTPEDITDIKNETDRVYKLNIDYLDQIKEAAKEGDR